MQEYLIYLRKSRQDNPNESVEEVLARHERILQEYALTTFGYRIDEENIYREIVSGETIEDRPQINLIFNRLQDPSIKGVLVVEVQRLTRGDMLDCGTIVHIFRYSNTLIVTPQKTYDLSDKYDRKFFEMELSRGNDYLEYTKEILYRGRMQSMREGNYIGTYSPFGYDRVWIDKCPTLKINEYEAQYVKLIFEMYNNGSGSTHIATTLNNLGVKPRKLDFWRSYTIRVMLENPIYCGKIRIGFTKRERIYENGKVVKKRVKQKNCEVVKGKHPAIVSEELFDSVQKRRGSFTKEKKNLNLINMFAGILICKKCGHVIKLDKYKEMSRYKCSCGKFCPNSSCNSDVLDNAVISTLKTTLEDFSVNVDINNTSKINSQERLLESLYKQLDKLEDKQNKLYDYLESGVYTKEVFKIRNNKLSDERNRINESIKTIEENKIDDKKRKEVSTSLHQAIDMLEDKTIPVKLKNDFLKSFIKAIYYEKEGRGDIKLEIEYK